MLHFLSLKHLRILCKNKEIENFQQTRFYPDSTLKKKCQRCEKLIEGFEATGEPPQSESFYRKGAGTIMPLKNPKKPKPMINLGQWKKTKCPSCKTDVMFYDNGNKLEAHHCTVCSEDVLIIGAVAC